ncbi:MAG: tripartite tricarboxylate transporter permease [bacterium]
MAHALLSALAAMAQWPNPLLLVLGALVGTLFGVLPGLGGAVIVALMTPLTFSMDPLATMFLLLTAQGGVSQAGALSAILIGVPGSSVSAATVFDGHELAKQGKAGVAIAASAVASAFGMYLGLAILAASIPVLLRVLLWLGPPEFFMMTFMGLTIIALAVEGHLLGSLISGALGLLLSMIGYVTVVGGQRFTFGNPYLWDGLKLVPLFIGLFAIPGSIELLLRNRPVATISQSSAGQLWEGTIAVARHWRVWLQSSLLGVIVGMIPGVGGAVTNVLAYGVARRTARDPESYGRGNVAGVVAPEAASDSKDGGGLMPLLALGIPTSESMAVLLGVFVLHGIVPGNSLLTEHLPVVWAAILALLAGSTFSSVITMIFANQLIKLTEVPVALYAPAMLCISLVGAYAVNQNVLDVVTALLFGGLGYAMIRYGYSRIALVLGFMLGVGTEAAFWQSEQIARGSYTIFFTRPISLGLAIIIVAGLTSPLIKQLWRVGAPAARRRAGKEPLV